MENTSDSARDEDVKRAVRMIGSGLDILLSRFDYGEPIPVAELLAARAERFGGSLTDAEAVVLTRFAEGEEVDGIAEFRGVKRRTIENQLSTAVQKLGFRDRRELKGYLEGVRETTARRRADAGG